MSFVTITLAWLACGLAAGSAQETSTALPGSSFADASAKLGAQLEAGLAELDALRKSIAAEQIPLQQRLTALEAELTRVRAEVQETSRLLDARTLDISSFGTDIQKLEEQHAYVSNLLNEYARNFESRLHVAELQRYSSALEACRQVREDPHQSADERQAAQVAFLEVALGRCEDALGGARFSGTAVDPSGTVQEGMFVLLGPATLFGATRSAMVGTAEQRLGSLEPNLIPFQDRLDAVAASAVLATGQGEWPLDPTLGNANKVAAATRETVLEHIEAGGPVMKPILGLAALALLVALGKLVQMSCVRRPSRRQIDELLAAVAGRDESRTRELAQRLPGPTGRMLAAGVDHLREPRELIEEVLYEAVLKTRLGLNRFLPFVGVSASAAPLLGLLGTVTGIITTFKLITVFGSGDVKMLSGGISEALITTEYGLYVAIPALLLHAFLSRRAKALVSDMEGSAVAFLNQVSRTPWGAAATNGRAQGAAAPVPDAELVRAQVNQILGELLRPLLEGEEELPRERALGGR